MAKYEFVTIIKLGLPMQVPANVEPILQHWQDTEWCSRQAKLLDDFEYEELQAALHTIARRRARSQQWDRIVGPIILIGKRR